MLSGDSCQDSASPGTTAKFFASHSVSVGYCSLEHLVGGDRDPDERVERVDVLDDPDGEHRLGRRLSRRRRARSEERCSPMMQANAATRRAGSTCHHVPSNLTGGSGRHQIHHERRIRAGHPKILKEFVAERDVMVSNTSDVRRDTREVPCHPAAMPTPPSRRRSRGPETPTAARTTGSPSRRRS